MFPFISMFSSFLQQSISSHSENIRGFPTLSGGVEMDCCIILENIQMIIGTRCVKKTHLKQIREGFNISRLVGSDQEALCFYF